MVNSATFSVVDYCVFVGVLVVSLLIGAYHAFRGRKQQTNEEVLLGGRKMTIMPVAISIMASYLSAILILGSPADVYDYGIIYCVITLAFPFSLPLSAWLFVPIFYQCRLTSIFEYIDRRFDYRPLHVLSVFCWLLCSMTYLGLALYAPSLALSSTTSLSLEASIISTALVGTLYTTFGGLKAVVWADVLQAIIMAAGMIAIVAQGAVNAGGFVNMFSIAGEHGRLAMSSFKLDPWERYNLWNVWVGSMFRTTMKNGADQPSVQRYSSLPSLRAAQWACILNTPIYMSYIGLASLTGIAIFSTYATCDPLRLGLMKKRDQVAPYFVLDQMSYLTGLPGLFVACVMSGALSTISSGLNSLAAITWTDFLSNFAVFQNMSELRQSWVTRFTSFLYGCLAVALAFLAGQLGGLVQATMAMNGALGGPVLGVFCLGIFVPFANGKGAVMGLVISTALTLWAAIGAFTISGQAVKLPSSIEGCPANLTSLAAEPQMSPLASALATAEKPGFIEDYIYSISYWLYTAISCLLCVLIGAVASLLTGGYKGTLDPVLVNPLAYKLFNRFNAVAPAEFPDRGNSADGVSMATYKQTITQ